MEIPAWPPVVALHVVAASLAMLVGPVNMLRRPRGDRPHKIIGRSWVGLMYFTAISSFWIQELRPGNFSWIHGLSVFTVITLTSGLINARIGRIRWHAANMIGSYSGILGAFIGAVIAPSRLIPKAFQHDWTAMTVITAAIIGTGLGFVALVVKLLPESTPQAPEPDQSRA